MITLTLRMLYSPLVNHKRHPDTVMNIDLRKLAHGDDRRALTSQEWAYHIRKELPLWNPDWYQHYGRSVR